jgi:hypothetical protein
VQEDPAKYRGVVNEPQTGEDGLAEVFSFEWGDLLGSSPD